MKILTWNMGYWQYRNEHDEAWEYLIQEIKPDIALLQEAVPPDDLEESGKVLWKPIKRRGWGSGIYCSSHELEENPLNSIQYRGWVEIAKLKAVGVDDLVIAGLLGVRG
jgi:hypothetical protein